MTRQHGATGARGAQTEGSLLPLLSARRRGQGGLLEGPQVAERTGTSEAGELFAQLLWQFKQLVWQLQGCSASENHVINLAQACVSTAEIQHLAAHLVALLTCLPFNSLIYDLGLHFKTTQEICCKVTLTESQTCDLQHSQAARTDWFL